MAREAREPRYCVLCGQELVEDGRIAVNALSVRCHNILGQAGITQWSEIVARWEEVKRLPLVGGTVIRELLGALALRGMWPGSP